MIEPIGLFPFNFYSLVKLDLRNYSYLANNSGHNGRKGNS